VIWKMDFRPATLLWLLVIVFVIGAGLWIMQEIRGRETVFPLTVVHDDAELRGLKQRADSIMAIRKAREKAPIGINTATAADFERLDGIGVVLAARIVAYRDKHGLFHSVDELDNVSGIGPKRMEGIRARCVLDSVPK